MANTSETAKRIGDRIRKARRFRGWEMDELATRSGITRKRLERFEATGALTCDELEKLSIALRLPIEQFLGDCVLCCAEPAAF